MNLIKLNNMKTKTDNNSTIDLSKHTKGEWYVGDLERDKNMCPVPFYEICTYKDMTWIAHVSVGSFKQGGEAEANAALIVKAVNNHFLLLEALKDCLDIIGETNAVGFSKESKPISTYFKAKQLIEQLK